MKRIKYNLITLLVLSGLLFSCNEDRLNLENLGAYDPGVVWNSAETAQYYVNNLYTIFGDGWTSAGEWTEESSGIVQQGAVTTDNGAQSSWPYSTVRRINTGLRDAQASSLSDNDKSRIMGQLCFLRAWLYFGMVFQHGGVPIIKEAQSVDDDLYVTRNTTAECFDFIIEDLDFAIASGIDNMSRGSKYGMIDKGAAKAFKGRVLLYKASPMFNPGNPWNNAYWQDAYNANKQAYIDLSAYGFSLVSSYANLFNDQRGQSFENSEYILPKIYKYPNSALGWRERQRRPLSVSTGDTGSDQPVWEHILLYPMLDGRSIGESTKYPYTLNTYFRNRDPRFYKNIYYNGGLAEVAFTLPAAGRRQYCTDDLGSLAYPLAFYDYVRLPPVANEYSRTGFFPRKGIMESNDADNLNNNDIDYPFIRFAEVLLNYAEAANETGHLNEAVEMLKLLRARAGIEPGMDNNYGINSGSREALREVIQDETAIELYQEGRRWPNMRRWRRLNELDLKQKHLLYARVREEVWANPAHTALVAGKNPALNELLPEDFTYQVYTFISPGGLTTSYLPETYYFFPIKRSHIELNSNLEQNIGWDNGTFDPTLH